MATTKIGFIGTGGIAQGFHMPALEKIKDVQIVAVCDTVKDKAEEVAQKKGATAYTDYKKMLADEKLNACYVCVPPFAHGTIEVELATAGVPFLVEKPVHLDLKVAKKAARIVEKKKLVTSSGHQDRYQKIIDKAQKFLAKKDVAMVMGYWMGGMPGVPWWRRKEMSGGQIVEQTIHIFDLARYLFGDVKTVFASGSKGLMKHVPKYNVEDSSAVTLQFQSGLVGVIFSSCCLERGRSGLDIYCTDSFVEYKERSSLEITQADRREFYKMTDDLALAENKAFIDAVRTKKPDKVRSSYPDCVKTLAVCIAANESMATGKAVKVTG